MKLSIYVDATIPSYLFDERDGLKLHIDATQKCWNEERFNFGERSLKDRFSYSKKAALDICS